MSQKIWLATLAGVMVLSGGFVFAAKDARTEEAAMMAACKKEYPEAIKDKKTAKDVLAWIETEEDGPNGATFKKSTCFGQHLKLEVASGRKEKAEKTEY